MMTADADYRAEPPAGAGHGGSAVMSYVGAALSVAIVIGIGVYAAALHVARRNEERRRRGQRGDELEATPSHRQAA